MPQQVDQTRQEQTRNIHQEQEQTAAPQQQSNQTGIPDNLKASIEYMSGISLADVRVEYNSDKPAQMGAYAYTQGNIIYIAPGQEKHLAHELWHIVQQREGKVKKNTEFQQGVAGNDDKRLEDKADQQGQKAKQMAKIPDLLPQKELKNKKTPQEIVQRARIDKETHYGKFFVDDAAYDFTADKKKLNAHISFEPGENTDATKIGLVQTVKSEKEGSIVAVDPNAATKMTATGERIDRLSNKNNPVYGAKSLGAGKGLEDTLQTNNTSGDPTNLEPGEDRNAKYDLGHHYKANPEDEEWTAKDAGMFDAPTTKAKANSLKEFETTALALDGVDKGEYYGSVKWGWTRDGSNTLEKIDFELVSEGAPTKNFMEAAQKWNDGKTRGTLSVKNDGTSVTDKRLTELFQLQAGDTVKQLKTMTTTVSIKVLTSSADASLVGETGLIKKDKLEDMGDGKETVDLPIMDIKVSTENDLHFGEHNNESLETDIVLPLGTRMKVLEEEGDFARVEIVQGEHTGKIGWVEKSAIENE